MTWEHEWDSDVDNEFKIVERLHDIWDCTSEKLAGFAYADFLLMRGEVNGYHSKGVAFCEIRCRSTPKDKYETIFITLNKYKNMLEMSRYTGLKPLFVVQWADQCGYVELTINNLGVTYPKRRSPRGRNHEDEPCVLLPVSEFVWLWNGSCV